MDDDLFSLIEEPYLKDEEKKEIKNKEKKVDNEDLKILEKYKSIEIDESLIKKENERDRNYEKYDVNKKRKRSNSPKQNNKRKYSRSPEKKNRFDDFYSSDEEKEEVKEKVVEIQQEDDEEDEDAVQLTPEERALRTIFVYNLK
jgi:hypothetical protein